MRSARACLLLTTVIAAAAAADGYFSPTPIPLRWSAAEREGRDEAPAAEPAPGTVPLPSHYWEDALKHSVYLTLVRDKIDQLIASEDRPEADDADLWERIRRAPFDNARAEPPGPPGDVAFLAKGRLIDRGGRLHFTEDERNMTMCRDAACPDDVRAYWSVKRVRQRDEDGARHELTFSVITPRPPRAREAPARTFTVREAGPETVVDAPVELAARPGRSVWYHKNVVSPATRQHLTGWDKIFSQLFSDGEEPKRQYVKPYAAKPAYVAAPSDAHAYRKPAYQPYKPTVVKYVRPMLAPAYVEDIGVVSSPYSRPPPPEPPGPVREAETSTHADPNYFSLAAQNESAAYYSKPPSSNTVYQSKPPSDGVSYHKKPSSDGVSYHNKPPSDGVSYHNKPSSDGASYHNKPSSDNVQYHTKPPSDGASYHSKPLSDSVPYQTKPQSESASYHSKPPTPGKVSYFAEHVRPPVYNAPPGVLFLSMDKKPFKPLPPLRVSPSKPYKTRPLDFRPSLQLFDQTQNPVFEDAFKPIAIFDDDKKNGTTQVADKQPAVVAIRQSTPTDTRHDTKFKTKKHEVNRKFTTPKPDIITAHIFSVTDETLDDLGWAISSSEQKTHKNTATLKPVEKVEEKPKEEELITPVEEQQQEEQKAEEAATLAPAPVTRRPHTTTRKPEEPLTTAKARRTRPPHKFSKPTKPKKNRHGSRTTTKAPANAEPEEGSKPKWAALTAQSTTTEAPRPTTTRLTTTRQTTTRLTTARPTPKATSPPVATTTNRNNRYRQSTLMYKGTSVKHDKWSLNAAETVKNEKKVVVPLSFPRRKGSNFQGYVSTTTARPSEEEYDEYTTPAFDKEPTTEVYFTEADESGETTPDGRVEVDDDGSYEATTPPPAYNSINEIVEAESATEEAAETTPKPKCKKKKATTTTEDPRVEVVTDETPAPAADDDVTVISLPRLTTAAPKEKLNTLVDLLYDVSLGDDDDEEVDSHEEVEKRESHPDRSEFKELLAELADYEVRGHKEAEEVSERTLEEDDVPDARDIYQPGREEDFVSFASAAFSVE